MYNFDREEQRAYEEYDNRKLYETLVKDEKCYGNPCSDENYSFKSEQGKKIRKIIENNTGKRFK